MDDRDGSKRVVIVGGGFGGLFAARALRGAACSVTLVDSSTEHVFQPLLYQCATGILSEGQISAPLRKVLRSHRNLECIMAHAYDVDVTGRRLVCKRPGGAQMTIPYDYLIMACGVEQSYFGHDEFAMYAPGMKTLADALTIRRRVFGAFEMAESAPESADQRRWLTFALVGAGPTGVELAGQIRELATKTLRNEYRHFAPKDARVLLFDGGKTPLAAFSPRLCRNATDSLRDLGVELHMGSRVTKVDETGVMVTSNGGAPEHYDAGTVLWTAGVAAPPVADQLAKATGAERDRAGHIMVGDDLTIAGYPEISVVGDVMGLHKLPGLAEVAMQSGWYAGHRIKRELAGQPPSKPFRYFDLGSAAYISRGKAVVEAGPMKVSGLPGWVIWLFIHIAFLTGYRNRVGAILTWWVALTRDVRRERAYPTRKVGLVSDIYNPPGEQTPGR